MTWRRRTELPCAIASLRWPLGGVGLNDGDPMPEPAGSGGGGGKGSTGGSISSGGKTTVVRQRRAERRAAGAGPLGAIPPHIE
jgi:hypothetical protein